MSAFTAFLLTDETRRRLKARFPMAYPHPEADHITHNHGATDFGDLHWPGQVEVIGIVDDKHGLQTLLARIDGQTERPDGRTYHVTWSLDPDKILPPFLRDDEGAVPYEPRHSNAVIAYLRNKNDGKIECHMLDDPIIITVMPAHVEKKDNGERVINVLPNKPGTGYKPWGLKAPHE